jgi:hypothetical protein
LPATAAAAGGGDAQFLVENQQRFSDRVDDGLGQRPCVLDKNPGRSGISGDVAPSVHIAFAATEVGDNSLINAVRPVVVAVDGNGAWRFVVIRMDSTPNHHP